MFPELFIDIISVGTKVPCMYFITITRLLYLSLSGTLTIVNWKDTSRCMSVHDLFERYISCAKKW